MGVKGKKLTFKIKKPTPPTTITVEPSAGTALTTTPRIILKGVKIHIEEITLAKET